MNTVTRNNTNTVTFSYSKVYIWSTDLCGAETSDISERKSEIPGNYLNMVLKKEGEYQLDRTCEK
jgi:hypothetical protein